MQSLIRLIYTVINLYLLILVASVIMSWLIAFSVVNTRNQFVALLYDSLRRMTEPALRPIRRILPNLGGIDISPLVLFLLLYFALDLINEYFPLRAF